MSIKRPQFHGSFMGYSKTEVNSYLDKLETELDEYEKKKDTWSEKITTMELESINLNNVIASKDDEKAKLAEENKQLEDMVRVLRAKIDSQEAIISRMKQDYDNLQKTYDESESNPKRIQEAILSAQDLRTQIVDQANKDADDIRILAEADKASLEEKGRLAIAEARVKADQTMAEAKAQADQTVAEAKAQADMTVSEAQQKYLKLQSDYNQMLMDASGFKAELMNMYRRHMELLTAFPEKEIIAVDAVQIEEGEA